jgi:Flp pilus assembly pilin Flp
MSEGTGKSARRASVNYTNNAKIQHCRLCNLLDAAPGGEVRTFPIDTAWAPEHNRPSGIRFRVRLPNVACQPKVRVFTIERNCREMSILPQILRNDSGQDIAEYAVMLAVILVLVVGTIRLVGSNANNAFSSVASTIQ